MTVPAIWLRLALSSALILGAVTGAQAQAYPSKPVRLVLPYAPGGIIDYVGRTLGAKADGNARPASGRGEPARRRRNSGNRLGREVGA